MSTGSDPLLRIRHEAADPQTAPERLRELAQLPLLAPIVATNPAANAPLLRTLADSNDATTRAAIAAHPNAPLDLLLHLAGEFPAAYPHVRCDLYYADAQAYGPFPLTADSPIPPPIGGGGTDFRPFFAAVTQRYTLYEHTICIYLTDGFGDFPAEPPDLSVLWVVTAGGRALDRFPFGEAVRLLI